MGWSRRRWLASAVLVGGGCAALIALALYFLFQAPPDLMGLATPIMIGGIIGGSLAAWGMLVRHEKLTPQRDPVLTIDARGIVPRSGELIPWGTLRGLYVARKTGEHAKWTAHCTLYVERLTGEREELYSGFEGSWTSFGRRPAFVIVPSGGAPAKLMWDDVSPVVGSCRPGAKPTPQLVRPPTSARPLFVRSNANDPEQASSFGDRLPSLGSVVKMALGFLAAAAIPIGCTTYRMSLSLQDRFDPIGDRVSSQPWLAANDREGLAARMAQFGDEDGRRRYLQERVLRGTLEEFLKRHREYTVYKRLEHGVLLKDDNDNYYGAMEVTSLQGNRLVLGPRGLAEVNWVHPQHRKGHLDKWVFAPLAIRFDEERHYAGIYIDHWNRCELFVVYERSAGWPVPVQPVFYPRNIEPRLAAWRDNELNRVRRSWALGDDFACYPP